MKPVFKCSWRDPKLPEVTVTDIQTTHPSLLPIRTYRVEQVLLGVQLGEYLFLNPRPVINNVRAVWQPNHLLRQPPVSTIVVVAKDDYAWGLFAREVEAGLVALTAAGAQRPGFTALESHLWRWLEQHNRWVHYNYRGGQVPQTDWQVRAEDNAPLLTEQRNCLPVQAYAEGGYTFYYVKRDGQRFHVAVEHDQVVLYRTCYRRLHPVDVEWNTDDIFAAGDPQAVVCAYPVSRLRPYSFWSLLDLGVRFTALLDEFSVEENPHPLWQRNVASYDPYQYFSRRKEDE